MTRPHGTLEPPPGQDEARKQLLRRMILLQETERHQVAKELHEEVGQILTSLLVGYKVLDESDSLEEVKELLPALKSQTAEALETLRLLSVGLWPPLLEDLGLPTTLRSYVREFAVRYRLDVFFSTQGHENRLDAMTEVAAFRIAQEALINAARYAQATQIAVTLDYRPDRLILVVDDNGIGMDPERVDGSGPTRLPVGLIGMHERADFVGGTLLISSQPGHGVTVTLEIPHIPQESSESP
jgi:signal transduction histidine kinase